MVAASGSAAPACRRLPPPAAAVQVSWRVKAYCSAQPAFACRLPTMQESHATPVQALAFNHCDPQMGNLFATVGKDQATGALAYLNVGAGPFAAGPRSTAWRNGWQAELHPCSSLPPACHRLCMCDLATVGHDVFLCPCDHRIIP